MPLFKLLVWILLGAVAGWYLRPKWVFYFLTISGLAQSLTGFAQFVSHKSLGLYFLGESFLSPLNTNIARTFIDGGRLLRAYGTFPHPNILAAFLILSLLSCYYFFVLSLRTNLVLTGSLTTAIFINWLGLVLTFSRTGWVIGFLVSLIFILITKNKSLLIVVLLTILSLLFTLNWLIFPRVSVSYDDFSIQNRFDDYQLAWRKIAEKPFFGHGLTLAMGERPIHNLYLTIAVELGLVGLFLFLILISFLIIHNLLFIIYYPNKEQITLLIMFGSLLLFGLFDHFLWTLRPGLAMFWLIAGLLTTFSRSRKSG